MQPPVATEPRPNILLVDDDTLVLTALIRMLADEASLRVARSGEEALQLCRQAAPDLVLMDMQMGGMSGLDTLRALRADVATCQVPVVFVTGQRSEALRLELLAQGATDCLLKPLVESRVRARVKAALRRGPAPLASSPGATAPPRVLLVEDDANAMHALQRALVPLGVECIAAIDGERALALAQQALPDLILLDMCLPGLDGFGFIDAVRDDDHLQAVPILVVTQLGDEQTEASALDAGATDFLAKPYSELVLQARVRNMLRLRERTAAALRAERHRWQRVGDARIADIVAQSTDAVLMLDEAGRVALINPAASRLFGRTDHDALGSAARAWLPAVVLDALPALPAPAPAPNDPAAPAPAPRVEPMTLQWAPDGQNLRTLELSWSVVGDGTERLMTVVLHDLTLRESAEHEARERVRAEADSRAKSLMMSYLAHEMGNPLNAILGMSQLLAKDNTQPLNQGQHRRLQHIIDSGWLLSELLRDALDMARFEAGEFKVELQDVPLDQALGQAAAQVASQAQLASVPISLPAPAPGVQLRADPTRLQQCLINLLSNAVKYGGGSPVTLAVQVDAGQVAISVTDQGAGLSAVQQGQLYKPFSRLGQDSATGHGLGLVVTRLLANAMGGGLTLHSAPGAGCSFTLALALAQPPQPAPRGAAPA